MTVQELINQLKNMPPMMEVYIQTFNAALNPIKEIVKDDNLGIVELYCN